LPVLVRVELLEHASRRVAPALRTAPLPAARKKVRRFIVTANCISPSHFSMWCRYAQTVVAPVIEFVGTYDFAMAPDSLWEAVERFDWFGDRSGWLQEFRLEGDGLRPGSVLYGVVAPPLPYRMRVRVEIRETVRFESIDAEVHGDLEGTAHLRMAERAGGTTVDMSWTVEMMQRPMRLANRVAHPLLQWGHDRVVEMTLKGLPKEFGYRGP
jgi:hypothetical protein